MEFLHLFLRPHQWWRHKMLAVFLAVFFSQVTELLVSIIMPCLIHCIHLFLDNLWLKWICLLMFKDRRAEM